MNYYTFYQYRNWKFLLCATKKGLSDLVLYENQDLSNLIKDDFKMEPYVKVLNDYFKGNHNVNFKTDLKGTDFEMSVWNALLKIPFGETTTYKKIAEIVNRPKSARAIGNAVGKNPIMLLIPCHRVIRTDGGIGGFSSDINLKYHLLNFEDDLSANKK